MQDPSEKASQIRERFRLMDEEMASRISDGALIQYELLIDRYLNQEELCKRCPGANKCEYDGMLSFLSWETRLDGKEELKYLHRGFCEKKRHNIEIKHQEKTMKSSKLPSGLNEMTFETIRSSMEIQPVIAAGKEIVSGKMYSGLYIHGEPGRGKTHLAVAMLRAFMLSGRAGIYVTTADLMEKLKSLSSERKSFELLELIQNSPFLVLDDLGTEKPSDWVLERLFLILDHRSKIARSIENPDGVVTVVTSNYSLEDLVSRLSLQGEPTSGTRLVSRIRGMCRPAPMTGIDWRVKKNV